MFKKGFAFRKNRRSDQDDYDSDRVTERHRDLNSLSPRPEITSISSREPSPGSRTKHSRQTSIEGRSDNTRSKSPAHDPLGLKVLYRPFGERTVDIVFVHGLGGSSRGTWSKSHDLEFFWPEKFLPFEQDIDEARILSFGYNASFRRGSGKTRISVLDFAKDLLYDLRYAQDESLPEMSDLGMGERPIIFVVHSMGGLVVKEAYIQGQNDPTYENIIKSVSAIIFLSTPHRGTNLAKTLNRILQVSFIANPTQYIAELTTGSQTIQKLNEQFRHIAPKLQIVSFYETRATTIFGNTQIVSMLSEDEEAKFLILPKQMVLEKDSAVLGYPGEISKALDADHHGVCKYDDPEDPRYITVRNALKSLVGKVTPKAKGAGLKGTDAKSGSTSQHSMVNFEDYLSVLESPNEDYNFFRDRWTPGTCSWILSHEAFDRWLNEGSHFPRILWIHGNAASGKSILSSFIIDHLIQLGLPCHYFFIRFLSQKKRTLGVMLRSLACQLARSTSTYGDALRQLAKADTDLKTADFRNIWQWLYKQTLFHLEISHPLYLIIDGVDEADNSGSVIRLFSDLQLTTIPLRVIFVSRKTHEITSAFQKLEKYVQMETVLTEGNQDDFRSYIELELDIACDDSYKREVTDQLLERARGNFLWVHLAVQKINECYTKVAVDNALKDLPPGMEALYHRMASSVQNQLASHDGKLGQNILSWTACAHRVLSVEELGDALGTDGLLEIHRTIGDLCGGFIVVDKDGKVAMIHETAREYLMRGSNRDRPFAIDRRPTNDMLLNKCLLRLTDPTLRGQINRNRAPALLDYASNSWFVHLSQGSATNPDVLNTVVKFLRGPHVLTWINVVARNKQLGALVIASRYLTNVALKLRKLEEDESLAHHQAVDVIESWATDFVKIVGKFGNNLSQNPDSIHKLVPAFCPRDSIAYQQFGRKESKTLHISGITSTTWDDCLARFSLEQGAMASAVLSAGSRIVILTNIRKSSYLIIYSSVTFEEQRRISHPERVLSIQVNKLGDRLVSYGYVTTKVWDIVTGDCVKTIANPAKRPRPHTIQFVDGDNIILVGGEDRCFRFFSLQDDSASWTVRTEIQEERLEDTTVNLPTCTALSPDGNKAAFGYRQHPVTVWELEPPMLLGSCNMTLDESNKTIQGVTWGEVFHLNWHPFSGEVFGLNQTGLLFKWDPYEEVPNAKAYSGGDNMAVSRDGSLAATGDAVGTIKIYATPDLSLLYQLSSQDSVLHLSFSMDSRRLYDIRGAYGNVWEPNTLVRLADNAEYPDHNSDTLSETESLAKLSLFAEHQFGRVDSVSTLSGQSISPLYCYGTENGVAVLGEVGSGKVCELERLTSFMSIEKVAWSEDGSFVAIADLSRRVSVKRITKMGPRGDHWQVHHEFDLNIPFQGGISQLLFHPAGDGLLASTSSTLYSIDLKSHEMTKTSLSPTIGKLKWTPHPTHPDCLLAFGIAKLHVFAWPRLEEVAVYTYFPLRAIETEVSSDQTVQSRGSFKRDKETLGRLISSVDSAQILLEIAQLTPSGQFRSSYLMFTVTDLHMGRRSNGHHLSYTLLPAEVASRIREPLAFLSHRRLVFLDVDRWICTWRLPSLVPRQPKRGRNSDQGAGAVERHYYLPGDWATANEAQLCAVMPDGTLLCPRNGEVATVQSMKLRK